MKLIKTVIQTIFLVITEIFPISTSGHLAFIRHFRGDNVFSPYVFIAARFALLIPIIFIFRKTFLMLIKEVVSLVKDIKNKKFTLKSIDGNRRVLFFVFISSLVFSVIFIPTRKVSYRLFSDLDIIVEGVFLLISGAMLYFADRKMPGNKLEVDLTLVDSTISGGLKGLFSLPGLSGSNSMFSFLIYKGFNREFANSLAIILLVPSLILTNISEMRNVNPTAEALDSVNVLLVVAVSLVFGFLAIKLLQLIIRSDRLNVFANYLLFIGGLVTVLGVIESVLDITIYEFLNNVIGLLN